MLSLVVLALTGVALSNPIDGATTLQPREDVSNNHFDLCRLLGCPRPTTTTTTVIVTSTATITPTGPCSATSTLTVTATASCSVTSTWTVTATQSCSAASTWTVTTTELCSTTSGSTSTTATPTLDTTITPTTATSTLATTTTPVTSTDTTSKTSSIPDTTTTPNSSTNTTSKTLSIPNITTTLNSSTNTTSKTLSIPNITMTLNSSTDTTSKTSSIPDTTTTPNSSTDTTSKTSSIPDTTTTLNSSTNTTSKTSSIPNTTTTLNSSTNTTSKTSSIPDTTTTPNSSTDTTSKTSSIPDTTTPTSIPTTTTSTPLTTTTSTTASTTTSSTSTSPTTTPSPIAKPLECSTDAYFIQDRSLLRVNLKTGSKTTLSTTVGGTGPKVNAIGYNTLDNFIYGLQDKTIVRVSSDGSLQALAKVDIAANVGDIDADGQFYYSTGGNAWGQVDLKPGSGTYGKVVGKGVSDSSALPKGVVAMDWTYTPEVKGYLYSVGIDGQGVIYVMRWSVQTHKWEVSFKGVPSFGLKGSGFGAVVATSDGVVYASHNGSGQILRIPLANPNGASRSPLGPKANTSDGCRCALRPDVAA